MTRFKNRSLWLGAIFLAGLLGQAGWNAGRAFAADGEDGLAEQIKLAERIIIGIPEDDVDVAGGEEFLVEIDTVLRGNGKQGTLARVVQSGDKKRHPKYSAGEKYIFLLKKREGAKGWDSVTLDPLPVTDNEVTYLVDGEADEMSLDEFQELVSGNAPAPPEEKIARETMAGSWILVLSQNGNDFYVWLVDISKEKQAYEARLLATSGVMSASVLKSFEIEEDSAHLVFDADGVVFDFQGKLTDGVVLGNVWAGGRAVETARLVATQVTSMRNYNEPRHTEGRNDFLEAVASETKSSALQAFAEKYPNSPMSLVAYRELTGLVKEDGLKPAAIAALCEKYHAAGQRWGERIEVKTDVNIGVALSRIDAEPELALKYLKSAVEKFTDETPESWKLAAEMEIAKLQIRSGEVEEGLAALGKLQQSHPLDPELMYLLAQQQEKAGKTDAAIELYASIVALPMMEQMLLRSLSQEGPQPERESLPSSVLERLWNEKHGNTDGLATHLDKLYEHKMKSVFPPREEPRGADAGTRVALCELFTGSECPPCVGADLAAGGLEVTFAPSEVIVLRYHQHIPAPDPLANDDSQERFQYYQGAGTPSMYVDGKDFEGSGGFVPQVDEIYRKLREVIDPVLTERINLKIDLSARATQGKIAVSAKAGGIPSFPEQVRLRLVLAEDAIRFPAGNGIRTHEMVVRSMPGGVAGIEPDDGQLAYEGEVDVDALRNSLKKYLSNMEVELTAEFRQKPLELEKLHVVAFLQDDKTHEVLQAVSVPVVNAAPKAAAPKPAATKPAAAAPAKTAVPPAAPKPAAPAKKAAPK